MVEDWGVWWNKALPYDGGIVLSPSNILQCGFVQSDIHRHFKQDLIDQFLPHCLSGEDKEGRPIYWEWTGGISQRMSESKKHFSVDDLVLMHVRTMELMVLRAQVSSQRRGLPVDKFVVVYDLNGLSYSPDVQGFNAFHSFMTIDQNFYPERLHRLVMINAPWFFSYIWAIIKPWIDPNTVKKVCILGTHFLPQLRELISDDHIPHCLGGALTTFEWRAPYPESSGVSPAQVADYLAQKARQKSA